MTTHPRSPEAGRYLRFAGLSVAVIALLAALGWIPTRRWAGAEAIPALLVGCGVSLAAALVGGLVIVRTEAKGRTGAEAGSRGTSAAAGPQALFSALKAMGLRLVVLLGLGVATALSGAVALKPFLLWTGISYLALLPVETRYALAAVADEVPAPGPDETTRETTRTEMSTNTEMSELKRP